MFTLTKIYFNSNDLKNVLCYFGDNLYFSNHSNYSFTTHIGCNQSRIDFMFDDFTEDDYNTMMKYFKNVVYNFITDYIIFCFGNGSGDSVKIYVDGHHKIPEYKDIFGE